MVLSHSEDLKCLCSVGYETYRLPLRSVIAQNMIQAGQAYHQKAMELRQGKQEGTEEVYLGSLGSPHLHIWSVLVMALAVKLTKDSKEQLAFMRYYREVLCAVPMVELCSGGEV